MGAGHEHGTRTSIQKAARGVWVAPLVPKPLHRISPFESPAVPVLGHGEPFPP